MVDSSRHIRDLAPQPREDLAFHHGARRSAPRVSLDGDLRIEAKQEASDAVLLNLSTGGIRLASEQMCDVGQVLSLRLRVADNHYEADGKVVWVRPLPDGQVYGLSFEVA